MPSPVGHSLAGYVTSNFLPKKREHNPVLLVTLSIFVANAADLDFLPGLLIGRPSLFHASVSHSLVVALGLSLIMAGLFGIRNKSFLSIFSLCFFAYSTHLLLDFFNPDGRPPYGIPLFWPLSNQYFISPVPVFLGVNHIGGGNASTQDFIQSVLSFRNLAGVALEVVILAPFVLVGRWYQGRKAGERGRAAVSGKLEEESI